MELELQNLQKEFSQRSVEMAELKKANSDLDLELKNLKNDREDLLRQIKYGKDLSSTLSLELARTKNEFKFSGEKIEKLSRENAELGQKIKDLTTTKIALEKSIVQMTEEKDKLEKKLHETETVIQDRIEEIWEIKDGMEERFKKDQIPLSSREIEIPPIVVSADQGSVSKPSSGMTVALGDLKGNVVSVNEDNNFVIVDLGQKAGVHVGDQLSVYRGSKYVAGLEVIQTRQDISAADIKQKVSEIKIGDNVRWLQKGAPALNLIRTLLIFALVDELLRFNVENSSSVGVLWQ